ncbi:hypothetical protein P170DRAFT_468214 [Aspergillus steynii IBT 23096]|uniref:Zn(2)-C6 fungal-type domain-containing protein n=1 Tax=Aspergillus steynii IBT 23096 TaxID=1392250 RepID=A0A2I2FV95_9EURO|nr:uncharacterized protein P170DRAFT_468214 [Aspergillus steynii IBT 23096]PLB44563.1 hypothetical protein P170DRAFT_468214 [Aspergillus steynii IBT 23096]
MLRRRAHKKSRRGCSECKKRHIKCDESVPQCGFCLGRKLDCMYGDSVAPATPSPKAQSPDSSSNRLLEAKLLHHYYTNTSNTVSSPSDYHQWHNLFPEAATSHAYVLDSVLAFTALHFAYLEPNSRQTWLEIGSHYNNRACSELRRVVGQVSASTLRPALVCSIYIALFANARIALLGDKIQSSHLADILQTRTLLKGCLFFHQTMENMNIRSGLRMEQYLWRDNPSENPSSPSPVVPGPTVRRMGTLVLEKFKTEPGQGNQSRFEICAIACQGLIDSMDSQYTVETQGRNLFLWPLSLDDSFMELLQTNEFPARLVFSLYALGIHFFKGFWYIGEAGYRLGRELLPLSEPVSEYWVDVTTSLRAEFEIDRAVQF